MAHVDATTRGRRPRPSEPQQADIDTRTSSFEASPRNKRRDRSWRRFSLFFAVYAFGWGLNFIYYFLIATPLGYQLPQSTFLLHSADLYSDLILTWTQAKLPNPYFTASISTYFPLTYALLSKTAAFSAGNLILAYLATSFAAMFSVWVWWLRTQWPRWKGDARWPVIVVLSATLAICNYPLLFALDRGNLDPVAMGLLFVALELLSRNRGTVGGVVLALASGLKGFPLAAILLWIERRRVLGAAVVVTGMVALILVPATTFEGGISVSLRGLLGHLGQFHDVYVVGALSSHYSADWLNAMRVLWRWRGLAFDGASIVPWYELSATLWAAALSFLALFVIRSGWRKLLAVVLIMLTFPNVANDYKLVFLLPVILKWLTTTASIDWRSTIFGISMALLMVPKHFYFPRANDVSSISCVISPVLISLASLVLWPTPTELTRFRDWIAGFLSGKSDATKRSRDVARGTPEQVSQSRED